LSASFATTELAENGASHGIVSMLKKPTILFVFCVKKLASAPKRLALKYLMHKKVIARKYRNNFLKYLARKSIDIFKLLICKSNIYWVKNLSI